jgi:DNA-binding CsgD family transcriptional regulator
MRQGMEIDYHSDPLAAPAARTGDAEGWVLMTPADVPNRWRDRAQLMYWVPVTPQEAERLLAHGSTQLHLSLEEEQVANLVADGVSAGDIAKRIYTTPRTVFRRIARLRDVFAATTTHELASRLARRGFGSREQR